MAGIETIGSGSGVLWSATLAKLNSNFVELYAHDTAQPAAITTAISNALTVDRTTLVEIFDDFTDATFDETNNWISFEGSAATAAVVVANVPEGQITMTSGAVGGANDGIVLSLIHGDQGALVSLGTTTFETRVSLDQLTGTNWCFGFSDEIAEASERNLYLVTAGTISDGGKTVANAVCFAFDSDATAATMWQFCSENAGTIAGSAAEAAHTAGPTADTYAVLRIVVESTGNAKFYIDGTLVKSVATAVATTAVLVPFIGGNTSVGAEAATVCSVDYVYFSHTRPTSNA